MNNIDKTLLGTHGHEYIPVPPNLPSPEQIRGQFLPGAHRQIELHLGPMVQAARSLGLMGRSASLEAAQLAFQLRYGLGEQALTFGARLPIEHQGKMYFWGPRDIRRMFGVVDTFNVFGKGYGHRLQGENLAQAVAHAITWTPSSIAGHMLESAYGLSMGRLSAPDASMRWAGFMLGLSELAGGTSQQRLDALAGRSPNSGLMTAYWAGRDWSEFLQERFPNLFDIYQTGARGGKKFDSTEGMRALRTHFESAGMSTPQIRQVFHNLARESVIYGARAKTLVGQMLTFSPILKILERDAPQWMHQIFTARNKLSAIRTTTDPDWSRRAGRVVEDVLSKIFDPKASPFSFVPEGILSPGQFIPRGQATFHPDRLQTLSQALDPATTKMVDWNLISRLQGLRRVPITINNPYASHGLEDLPILWTQLHRRFVTKKGKIYHKPAADPVGSTVHPVSIIPGKSGPQLVGPQAWAEARSASFDRLYQQLGIRGWTSSNIPSRGALEGWLALGPETLPFSETFPLSNYAKQVAAAFEIRNLPEGRAQLPMLIHPSGTGPFPAGHLAKAALTVRTAMVEGPTELDAALARKQLFETIEGIQLRTFRVGRTQTGTQIIPSGIVKAAKKGVHIGTGETDASLKVPVSFEVRPQMQARYLQARQLAQRLARSGTAYKHVTDPVLTESIILGRMVERGGIGRTIWETLKPGMSLEWGAAVPGEITLARTLPGVSKVTALYGKVKTLLDPSLTLPQVFLPAGFDPERPVTSIFTPLLEHRRSLGRGKVSGRTHPMGDRPLISPAHVNRAMFQLREEALTRMTGRLEQISDLIRSGDPDVARVLATYGILDPSHQIDLKNLTDPRHFLTGDVSKRLEGKPWYQLREELLAQGMELPGKSLADLEYRTGAFFGYGFRTRRMVESPGYQREISQILFGRPEASSSLWHSFAQRYATTYDPQFEKVFLERFEAQRGILPHNYRRALGVVRAGIGLGANLENVWGAMTGTGQTTIDIGKGRSVSLRNLIRAERRMQQRMVSELMIPEFWAGLQMPDILAADPYNPRSRALRMLAGSLALHDKYSAPGISGLAASRTDVMRWLSAFWETAGDVVEYTYKTKGSAERMVLHEREIAPVLASMFESNVGKVLGALPAQQQSTVMSRVNLELRRAGFQMQYTQGVISLSMTGEEPSGTPAKAIRRVYKALARQGLLSPHIVRMSHGALAGWGIKEGTPGIQRAVRSYLTLLTTEHRGQTIGNNVSDLNPRSLAILMGQITRLMEDTFEQFGLKGSANVAAANYILEHMQPSAKSSAFRQIVAGMMDPYTEDLTHPFVRSLRHQDIPTVPVSQLHTMLTLRVGKSADPADAAAALQEIIAQQYPRGVRVGFEELADIESRPFVQLPRPIPGKPNAVVSSYLHPSVHRLMRSVSQLASKQAGAIGIPLEVISERIAQLETNLLTRSSGFRMFLDEDEGLRALSDIRSPTPLGRHHIFIGTALNAGPFHTVSGQSSSRTMRAAASMIMGAGAAVSQQALGEDPQSILNILLTHGGDPKRISTIASEILRGQYGLRSDMEAVVRDQVKFVNDTLKKGNFIGGLPAEKGYAAPLINRRRLFELADRLQAQGIDVSFAFGGEERLFAPGEAQAMVTQLEGKGKGTTIQLLSRHPMSFETSAVATPTAKSASVRRGWFPVTGLIASTYQAGDMDTDKLVRYLLHSISGYVRKMAEAQGIQVGNLDLTQLSTVRQAKILAHAATESALSDDILQGIFTASKDNPAVIRTILTERVRSELLSAGFSSNVVEKTLGTVTQRLNDPQLLSSLNKNRLLSSQVVGETFKAMAGVQVTMGSTMAAAVDLLSGSSRSELVASQFLEDPRHIRAARIVARTTVAQYGDVYISAKHNIVSLLEGIYPALTPTRYGVQDILETIPHQKGIESQANIVRLMHERLISALHGMTDPTALPEFQAAEEVMTRSDYWVRRGHKKEVGSLRMFTPEGGFSGRFASSLREANLLEAGRELLPKGGQFLRGVLLGSVSAEGYQGEFLSAIRTGLETEREQILRELDGPIGRWHRFGLSALITSTRHAQEDMPLSINVLHPLQDPAVKHSRGQQKRAAVVMNILAAGHGAQVLSTTQSQVTYIAQHAMGIAQERLDPGISSIGSIATQQNQILQAEGQLPQAPQRTRAPMTGHIDINKATIQNLTGLPGIGPRLADRIVQARPFASAQDILNVPGIGKKKYEAIKDLISATSPAAALGIEKPAPIHIPQLPTQKLLPAPPTRKLLPAPPVPTAPPPALTLPAPPVTEEVGRRLVTAAQESAEQVGRRAFTSVGPGALAMGAGATAIIGMSAYNIFGRETGQVTRLRQPEQAVDPYSAGIQDDSQGLIEDTVHNPPPVRITPYQSSYGLSTTQRLHMSNADNGLLNTMQRIVRTEQSDMRIRVRDQSREQKRWMLRREIDSYVAGGY